MPVSEMVKYDCNVSISGEGTSSTIIVELPDGMEKHPSALEDALFKGVLKRLKVVISDVTRASPSVHDGLHTYAVHITTDRGFHIGKLKFTAPFATGWNNTEVTVAENYHPSEIDAYVMQGLRDHLAIRINQRMPPLPRAAADAKGMSPDYVYTWAPQVGEYRFEDTLLKAMMPTRDREWMAAMDGRTKEVARLRYEQDMKLRLAATMAVPNPEVLKELRELAEPARDVTKRQEANRTDVALRGGSHGRDVATMGTELDL